MQTATEPTIADVRKYVERYRDEQLVVEQALGKLFRAFPNNTAVEEVLLKVVALNGLYKTNILATWDVAHSIVMHNIDARLTLHLPEVVDETAPVVIKGKTRRNYSFASKYCSWHFPHAYPIYDRYVDNLLWAYEKQTGFSGFRGYDLWNSYPRFSQAVRDFQTFFHLEQFSIKELDSFLWLYGKEYADGASPTP